MSKKSFMGMLAASAMALVNRHEKEKVLPKEGKGFTSKQKKIFARRVLQKEFESRGIKHFGNFRPIKPF